MASHIIAEEAFAPVSLRGGRIEWRWKVIRTDGQELSYTDALTALLDEAPATEDGLVRQAPTLDQASRDMYYAVVEYAPPGITEPETDDFEVLFEIGPATRKIMRSYETISSHAPPGKTPIDFDREINVVKGGTQGVEVNTGGFILQRTHYIADSTVNTAYIKALADFVGTVNNATFDDFPAGELLLLGAAGRHRQLHEDWGITLRWSRRQNQTGQTVGEMTGIDQDGWDYLWTFNHEVEDVAAEWVRSIPLFAYVERVFLRTNHNNIFA